MSVLPIVLVIVCGGIFVSTVGQYDFEFEPDMDVFGFIVK